MASTKGTVTTGWSSTSVGAGSLVTGTAMDYSAGYGGGLTVQVVTTTAPTSNGTLILNTAPSTGGTFVQQQSATIPQTGSATLSYSFLLDIGFAAFRLDVQAGTGTAVTVSAQAEQVTGI